MSCPVILVAKQTSIDRHTPVPYIPPTREPLTRPQPRVDLGECGRSEGVADGDLGDGQNRGLGSGAMTVNANLAHDVARTRDGRHRRRRDDRDGDRTHLHGVPAGVGVGAMYSITTPMSLSR